MNIIQLYKSGKTISEIHKLLGISKYKIRKELKYQGIILTRRLNLSDNIIKKEYLKGMNVKEISKKYDISYSSISYRIKKLGIGKTASEIMRNPFINHNFFNFINNENSYWGGFIASDGCVLKTKLSFTLKKCDIDAINKFANAINFNNKLYSYKNQIGVVFGSEEICSNLYKNFNITEKKSLTLKPPVLYNESNIRNFIRGYLDGDGYICKTEYKIGFAGTKEMLSWVSKNLNKYCFSNKTKICAYKNICEISFGGRIQTKRILEWLYKDSVFKTRLDRKYNIAKNKYLGEFV